jgi:hypothetical protein
MEELKECPKELCEWFCRHEEMQMTPSHCIADGTCILDPNATILFKPKESHE